MVRTSSESTIRHLAQQLAEKRGTSPTILEITQRSSDVEHFFESLREQMYVLHLAVEEMWGESVSGNSPWIAWMIRHASWTLARFQPHGHVWNQTSFGVVHEQEYCGEIFPFGAPVVASNHYPTEQPGVSSNEQEGVYLGKEPNGDEHLVCVKSGIFTFGGQ